MIYTDYPFNLIRAIYKDAKDDNTHTETTYIKGLYEQIKTLTEREQALLSMRYKDGLTLKQCGERCRRSDQVAGKAINKALRKLGHPSRAQHYEAVPKIKIKHLENRYKHIDEQNQHLNEALRALNGDGVNPHVVILLAKMLRPEQLGAHISELNLSTRACNALLRSGVVTIKDVIITPEEKLIKLPNVGERTMQEIKAKIEAYILFPAAHQTGQGDTSHESNTV